MNKNYSSKQLPWKAISNLFQQCCDYAKYFWNSSFRSVPAVGLSASRINQSPCFLVLPSLCLQSVLPILIFHLSIIFYSKWSVTKKQTNKQLHFVTGQSFALFKNIHPNILEAFLAEESIKYLQQQYYVKIWNKEIAPQGNGTTLKLISYSNISKSVTLLHCIFQVIK